MSGFDGCWELDPRVGRLWDQELGAYVADEIGSERIEISTRDGIQRYRVEYGTEPTLVMGYSTLLDSPHWSPYEVLEARGGRGSTGDLAPGDLFGLVRTVYVDRLTHYRLSKSAATGAAEYVMLRRLEQGGGRFTSTVLDSSGRITIVRHFRRLTRRDA